MPAIHAPICPCERRQKRVDRRFERGAAKRSGAFGRSSGKGLSEATFDHFYHRKSDASLSVDQKCIDIFPAVTGAPLASCCDICKWSPCFSLIFPVRLRPLLDK